MKQNGQLVASLKYIGNNSFEGGEGYPKAIFELQKDGMVKVAVVTEIPTTKTYHGTKYVIDFQFPDPKMYRTTFYYFPYLIDIDGKRYETGRIIEEGLEPEFDPFAELNIYPIETIQFFKLKL